MKSRDELDWKVEVLEQRISALSAAVLRLGSSLDLATVLQEAADSARALTGTRYCLIVTVDEAGEAREFVASGLTTSRSHSTGPSSCWSPSRCSS